MKNKPSYEELELEIAELRSLEEKRKKILGEEQKKGNVRSVLIENANSAILRWNQKGIITYFNNFAEKTFGFSRDEIIGKHVVGTIVPESESTGRNLRHLMEDISHNPDKYEYNINENICKNGTRIWIAWTNKIYKNEFGEMETLSIGSDITNQRQIENKLQQSEKMRSIGQLAGGIAHDFNNQLTGILGYADILSKELTDEKLIQYAEFIKTGANRATELTKQLLAFSRKGKYLSTEININEIVLEVMTILQHCINKNITIDHNFMASDTITIGDPNQLQNAILNIALNARDAMPNGGNLDFDTNVIELEKNPCPLFDSDLSGGKYVLISIKDSGCGMSEETMNHVFEPFFTTKQLGKGTGMGLASVYGTIDNHSGCINIESEIDKGTTFHLYLPAHKKTVNIENKQKKIIPKKGTARILVIDDEDGVCKLMSIILHNLGYKVATCNDGKEAISYYAKSWEYVDLVILDLVLPGLGGKEIFEELKKINPQVNVLISSGYTIENKAQAIIDQGAKGFIEKPFTQVNIANAISKIIS